MTVTYVEKNHKMITGLLVLIAVFWSLIFIQFTVDDSYITFRYAKNLVEHGLWNWDLNNVRVEAYTNFLYAILAIIPEKIGINTPLFFKFIGVSSIVYLSFRLYKLIDNKVFYFMALAFLLINPFVYIHAYSGLETPVFIVLLFELTVLLSISNNLSSKNESVILAILLLLPMTRPEGALFSLVGFGLLLYKQRTIKSKSFFIGVLGIGIGYFIWRYQYFGLLFPNTFYIKSTQGFSLSNVVMYLISNVHYFIPAFTMIFFVKNISFRLVLIAVIILNMLLYGNSDLQMNYADRFPFQTFIPVFLALFVIVKNRAPRILTLILVSYLLGGIPNNKWELTNTALYYPRIIQSHAKLGVALSQYKDENLSLMVGEAGMIPYFSEWHSYDFIGLADKYVGQNGFSEEYAQEISPDLLIVYSTKPNEEGLQGSLNQSYINTYIKESQQYSLVGATKFMKDFYLLSYLKKDTPSFEQIKLSIQSVGSQSRNFKISKQDFIMQNYLIFNGN